jgi:hypothetical protein
MSTGRIQVNAILLPDGTVLAAGGSVNNEAPDVPGRNADIYDPAAGAFRSGGTASYSRLYHSTAVLLPDATVATLGSNPGDRGKYLPAIEIYTPPYLYDANDVPITSARPAVTGLSPSPVNYGATFTVTYTSASPISSAVLVRPGSTTHAFDMDQRLVGLCGPSPQPPCTGAGSLSLAAPPNGNVAPPGFYMLFLLDASGVPSRAAWVELAPWTTTPAHGTIDSPAADVSITAGGTVSFGTSATAAKYSWVFPGGTPATSTARNPGNVTFGSQGCYEVSLTLVDSSNNSDPSPPTRMIGVNPTTANFDISVSPPSITVEPGGSATYTVTLTPRSGFTGNVSLAVSSEVGYPAGVSSGGFAPATISGSGSSTLTMNTTTSAAPYAVSLSVQGTSGSLIHTASTTLLINLPPPQGLTAAAADSQVSLDWQAVTGATGYRVERSLTAGGPYQTIACPTDSTYVDTGLTDGTTYYYVTSAVYASGPNAGGASIDSTEIAAMPPCPVPVYSGALGGSKSLTGDVVWSWDAGGATAFDLVQGDLMALQSSGGDFTAAVGALPAGEVACLASGATGLSLTDPYGAPPAGDASFTLLRAVATACPAHGTLDDGSATQAGGRDAPIAAAAGACP